MSLDFSSERAQVIGGFLQKRYERPTPLGAVPTRDGKSQERAYDVTGLPTDSASGPARIINVDDAVHGFRASSCDQFSRSQR